jgi:hypothetical protein
MGTVAVGPPGGRRRPVFLPQLKPEILAVKSLPGRIYGPNNDSRYLVEQSYHEYFREALRATCGQGLIAATRTKLAKSFLAPRFVEGDNLSGHWRTWRDRRLVALFRNEDQETFMRVAGGFGRPLVRDQLPARGKAFYDAIAERAKDLIAQARRAVKGLPPIYFDFIVNPQISAVAFRAGKRYFIGLNTGTVFMLRMVIGRMLSDPRTFISVGDPAEERDDLKPIAGYVPNADSMYQVAELLTPRNAIRRAYAEFLTDQAIMFFIGHEITHISHGHVAYLLDKRSIPYFSESSTLQPDDAELRLERQCLEQDADRRSIISRIDSLRVTMAASQYRGLPWAPATNGAKRMIRDWNTSLSILFRLFGDVRFSRIELIEATYPPLPIRRLYSEAVAHYVIDQQWTDGKMISVRDALNEGRNEAEEAFAIILGEPVATEGLAEAMSRAGADYMMHLQDYWNSTLG